MDSAHDSIDFPRCGLPHSDIHGSTLACSSPWLFAANHVLHRLLAPRHPPNALTSLTTKPLVTSSGFAPPGAFTPIASPRQVVSLRVVCRIPDLDSQRCAFLHRASSSI